MKWSICIATNPWRTEQLKRLMAVLEPQLTPEVEVLIFFNNFEYSLGYLRQCLLDEAKGEYICHIDDDDMVPEDYVATILPLLDGIDYIGFQVDFYDKGVKMKPVYHSLEYKTWYEDDKGYYRGVTHLNPIRTELARASGFPTNFNIGEDAEWARNTHAETEYVIDRPMYTYWHNNYDSVAYALSPNAETAGYHPDISKPHDTPIQPNFKSKQIRLHPQSTKELK